MDAYDMAKAELETLKESTYDYNKNKADDMQAMSEELMEAKRYWITLKALKDFFEKGFPEYLCNVIAPQRIKAEKEAIETGVIKASNISKSVEQLYLRQASHKEFGFEDKPGYELYTGDRDSITHVYKWPENIVFEYFESFIKHVFKDAYHYGHEIGLDLTNISYEDQIKMGETGANMVEKAIQDFKTSVLDGLGVTVDDLENYVEYQYVNPDGSINVSQTNGKIKGYYIKDGNLLDPDTGEIKGLVSQYETNETKNARR